VNILLWAGARFDISFFVPKSIDFFTTREDVAYSTKKREKRKLCGLQKS
jgi:hypothetical protein